MQINYIPTKVYLILIFFSLPRTMDLVEIWAQFWQEEMTVANNFAGFKDGKRMRTERVVFDVQIFLGK